MVYWVYRRRSVDCGVSTWMNRYGVRVGITALVVIGGWVVRERVVPGLLLYQHVVASAAFIVFIQVVWELFAWMHRKLDRWMPFGKYLYLRMVVQLVLGVGVLLAIRFVMLKPLQRWIPAMRDPVVVTMMLIANIGIALAINLLFISGHFIRQWKEGLVRVAHAGQAQDGVTDDHARRPAMPVAAGEAMQKFKSSFVIQQGAASMLVDEKDIAAFIKQDLIFLVQADRRKLVTSYRSLDEIEALVDPARYYRANRQLLIHRRVVLGYRTGQGKLVLSTTVDVGEAVTVSKEKAAAFKRWFDGGSAAQV
jgi:hypothetical protein